jgi:hypothetical protein
LDRAFITEKNMSCFRDKQSICILLTKIKHKTLNY